MSFSTLVSVWFSLIFRRKKVNPKSTIQQGLSKCLSTHQLIHLGIGATLGAGTYVVTGQVAANMAGPAVIISFTIAAFTSILSGLCYAEFGARVPQTTGSAYTYSYVTVGEIWAFFIGWNLILEYMIGTAADAAALSGSLDYLLGYRIKNWTLQSIGEFSTPYLGEYPDIVSFLATIIITIILAFGVRESAHFTVAFNIFNIIVILFIIVTGLFYIDINNWTGGKGFFPYGASGVLSGAATCFYAFVGFDIIATTGEEAKNPTKSIPVAIVASLIIIFLCYFGVSSIVTLIMPYNELDKLSPIPAAFAQRGLGWARYVISIGAICGLSSSLLGNLFPLPRIIYAMSKDGLLFSMFMKINKRTEVPVNATVYPGILTAIFALLFDLAELVEMMSIGTLLAYTLVSLCVLILRYQPDEYYGDDYQMQPLMEESNSTEEFVDEESFDRTYSTLNIDKISMGDGANLTENENGEFPTVLKSPVRKERIYSPKAAPNGPAVDSDFESKEEEKNNLNNSSKPVRREPTATTGRIVSCACISLFAWFFGFNSTLLFAFNEIYTKQMWALLLLLFFGVLIILSVGLIYSMPQSRTRYGFMAPCVPALPILAIYANTFLMLKLSTITWIRFSVWMVIGVLIYVFYGTRYSKANREEN